MSRAFMILRVARVGRSSRAARRRVGSSCANEHHGHHARQRHRRARSHAAERRRRRLRDDAQHEVARLDFSNRANAREIAFADPAPLPRPTPTTTQDGGDWSAYFYNGVIYETDITRGLFTCGSTSATPNARSSSAT
jgi:hypothetical protein